MAARVARVPEIQAQSYVGGSSCRMEMLFIMTIY